MFRTHAPPAASVVRVYFDFVYARLRSLRQEQRKASVVRSVLFFFSTTNAPCTSLIGYCIQHLIGH
ncbi:hypothetical protein [Photorhabdus asymbiotica]|uniref:hypothetical protein n=1 Tax=Photorhabdus asymbiotica TaxID=291112 RepID=UPI003DA6F90C